MIELLKVYAASCANLEQKSWNDFFYSLKKKSLLSFQNDENVGKNWYTLDTREVGLGNHHIIETNAVIQDQGQQHRHASPPLKPIFCKLFIAMLLSYPFASFIHIITCWVSTLGQNRPGQSFALRRFVFSWVLWYKVSSFIKFYVLSFSRACLLLQDNSRLP